MPNEIENNLGKLIRIIEFAERRSAQTSDDESSFDSLCDSDDVNKLASALRHTNEKVRVEAIRRLGNSIASPKSLDLIMGALSDSSELVRLAVLQEIGGTDIKIEYDNILKSLSDPSNTIREHAIGSLSNCVDPRVMDSLLRVLSDKKADEHCRMAASFVLPKFEKDVYDRKEQLVTILVDIINESGEVTKNCITTENITSTLAKIDEIKIADVLVNETKKRRKVAKYRAAILLASLGDHRAISVLFDFLNDRKNRNCYFACLYLNSLGHKLKDGINADITGSTHDKEQLQLIIDGLKFVLHNDKDEDVIRATADALLELLPKDELESFVESCLYHQSRSIVKCAIRSGIYDVKLKDEEKLITLLSDHDDEIRRGVIQLLCKSGDKKYIQHLLTMVDFPEVIASLPCDKREEKYKTDFEPRYSDTQIAVATALLELGNERGWPILSDSLFEPDSDGLDKSCRFSLLSKHGNKDVMYNLANRLIDELNQDENLQLLIEAAKYLYCNGNIRGLKILEEGLIQRNWDITHAGGFQCDLAEELAKNGNRNQISELFVRVLQNGFYFEKDLFNLIVSYLTKWGTVGAITPLNKYINNPIFGDEAKRAISILKQA